MAVSSKFDEEDKHDMNEDVKDVPCHVQLVIAVPNGQVEYDKGPAHHLTHNERKQEITCHEGAVDVVEQCKNLHL